MTLKRWHRKYTANVDCY